MEALVIGITVVVFKFLQGVGRARKTVQSLDFRRADLDEHME